ncbi:hypothetical protein BH10ACI4_BH10ACI4_04080 [soil metagenome]
MKCLIAACVLAFQVSAVAPVLAQNSNFFSKWENRVRVTSAKQPAWPVPVISPTPQLAQLFRTDFVRQYTPTHFTTWNYDNSKGFNFIPYDNLEIDVNLPPFIQHNNSKVADGAGDFSMVAKFRPFSGNEKHHNYSTAFQLAATGATGSYKNGTARTTFTPTLMGGKGYGRANILTTLGATMPVGSVATIGRTITWNTVAQVHVGKLFWPELEVNSNFYHGGPNDGKNQTFLSPGMMVSKIKFRRDPKDRLGLVFGAGFQIATSAFHTYNHGLNLTTRITF